MSPPASSKGHQVRKSRQAELPVIKFRSSCDLCTEAKVRCNKQHPQCGRCIRIGSSCRYSVSMRTGKPAIDLVKALNAGKLLMPPHRTAQTAPNFSTDGLDIDPSLRAVQLAADQGRSSRSTTRSSTPLASDSAPSPPGVVGGSFRDRGLSLDLGSGSMDSSTPFPSAMSVAQSNKMGPPSSSEQQNNGFMCPGQIEVRNIMDYLYANADDFALPSIEQSAQSTTAATTGPGFSLSLPTAMDCDYFSQFDLSEPEWPWINEMATPPASLGHCANDSAIAIDLPQQQPPPDPQYEHSCLRTTKILQQSIAMMCRGDTTAQRDDGGLLGSTPPITTTDQALLMCSSISKQLIEILRCQCDADAYLPFLITVIISKLLATYGAIAKVDDSMPFKFGSGAQSKTQVDQEGEKEQQQQQRQEQNHQHHQPQPQQRDVFTTVPLRLGAYDLDGELEGVLRAQLVLHELSKLECVVQLFAEKYCIGGNSGSGEHDLKLSEDRTIYSALGQFIKQRHARVREACEQKSPLPTLGK